MKLSTKILATLLFLLLGGLLHSNIVLKQEYDQFDKSDIYWTYGKILEQPFKYLKIKGGNLTNIAFEQGPQCSVRVLRDWEGYHEGRVKAYTKNDTLFVDFPETSKNLYEKLWMRGMTLVRIFSPQLLSVDGFNTRFEMFRLKQKSITVNISGKSRFEVESMIRNFDTLTISQRDTSEVVFEMSPEYNAGLSPAGKVIITDPNKAGAQIILYQHGTKNNEALSIQAVNASLQGNTLLDLGHAQIASLKLAIADSSAIILSGEALKKMHE